MQKGVEVRNPWPTRAFRFAWIPAGLHASAEELLNSHKIMSLMHSGLWFNKLIIHWKYCKLDMHLSHNAPGLPSSVSVLSAQYVWVLPQNRVARELGSPLPQAQTTQGSARKGQLSTAGEHGFYRKQTLSTPLWCQKSRNIKSQGPHVVFFSASKLLVSLPKTIATVFIHSTHFSNEIILIEINILSSSSKPSLLFFS